MRLQIAEARERFKWVSGTSIVTSLVSIGAATYHRNLFYTTPVVPLTMWLFYDLHQAYGGKNELILSTLTHLNFIVTALPVSAEADKILRDEQQRLSLRTVSVKEIDARINDIQATLPEFD